MKDAHYKCPKEIADAVEQLRVLLEKHYEGRYTFLISANPGKLIAAGNRPLAGGDVRANAE